MSLGTPQLMHKCDLVRYSPAGGWDLGKFQFTRSRISLCTLQLSHTMSNYVASIGYHRSYCVVGLLVHILATIIWLYIPCSISQEALHVAIKFSYNYLIVVNIFIFLHCYSTEPTLFWNFAICTISTVGCILLAPLHGAYDLLHSDVEHRSCPNDTRLLCDWAWESNCRIS